MSDFLNLVKAERQKQINKHGYTPEYDDEHTDGSIADAGACYGGTPITIFKTEAQYDYSPLFPWDTKYFKKVYHDRKQQLVIGAAFYMAEYERIVREEQKATANLCSDCNLCPATCGASPKFGTGVGNDNVYECDTFQPKPYQMSCPYGLDSMGDPIKIQEPMLFAPHHYQKILDRTKIRTARKRDKSGEFSIKGERFMAELEVVLTMSAFVSLFDSKFYTHEQFGFDSYNEVWEYYYKYFSDGDLVFVHKVSEVQL